MKNAKRKGTRNEHRSRLLLEAAGYRVTRAAGSFGEFDLVAISRTGILLVQCKSNRPPGPIERACLIEFPAPDNAQRLIHVWHDGQRLPEVREL